MDTSTLVLHCRELDTDNDGQADDEDWQAWTDPAKLEQYFLTLKEQWGRRDKERDKKRAFLRGNIVIRFQDLTDHDETEFTAFLEKVNLSVAAAYNLMDLAKHEPELRQLKNYDKMSKSACLEYLRKKRAESKGNKSNDQSNDKDKHKLSDKAVVSTLNLLLKDETGLSRLLGAAVKKKPEQVQQAIMGLDDKFVRDLLIKAAQEKSDIWHEVATLRAGIIDADLVPVAH